MKLKYNQSNIKPIVSPLTKTNNVIKLKTIQTSRIIELYKANFNINVEYLLSESTEIELFQCNDSGYRFYYPFNIAGDSAFYEQLQKFSWYYMPWKWEHMETAKFLVPNMKLLEVGCAHGEFLEKIQKQKKVHVVGLELNNTAVCLARKKGLEVFAELVEDHAKNHYEEYDVVCSYQVLEHITDIHTFIEGSLQCLKKDGLLIIGVPNNSSFVRWYADEDLLNMPPHHMGLWSPKTLKKLEIYYSLSFIKLKNEPLQKYHYDWYLTILENKLQQRSRILYNIFQKTGIIRLLRFLIPYFSFLITGHTTFVVFKKK
jgi:2-polyprenyl-3-methyl-5-hydroxy-6-metoxy-1,4-benzoquinol methylase